MDNKRTHRDLMPKDVCPSFMMKHILTHSMDDVVTLCEGLRRASVSAVEPSAEPAIDASIDPGSAD